MDSTKHKDKRIRKVTWIGLLVNLFLSFFKMLAGYYGKSQAVLADGVHSLSDTVTDIAIITGSYFWSKPPDSSHPYGHKRIETTVSIFIGVVILAAGAGIGVNAVQSLENKPAYSPGIIALLAALVSIISKEILYQWTASTGKKIKSLSLSANAWHHRLDAISSVPVLIAVGVSILWPKWYFVDKIGAIFISLLIAYAALKIIFTSFQELLDKGAPEEVRKEIEKIALENPEVHQVHGIRTRYAGNSLHVDLHILLNGSMTVFESHQVVKDIKTRIMQDGPDVVDVMVHTEPLRVPGSISNNT